MSRFTVLNVVLFSVGVVLAAGCGRTVAQESPPSDATLRTIHVNGRAVVHVAPDRAELTLGVETRDMKLGKAKAENDERVRALLTTIKAHGIASKDVHTSWISIHPEYSSYSSARKFDGYRVSNTVMVTFEDLGQVEPVLSEALLAGVSNVSNVTFRHSEDRTHRDRARELSIQAAREKAEAMAKALGQRVGRPVTIIETAPTWINPMSNANVFNDGASVGNPDTGDILAPGMVEIDARVSVTFELLD